LNFFSLSKDKKVVLSIGGSLGAQSINEAVDKDIQLFEENNLQLIWQTGKPYLPKAKERAAGKEGIFVSDFITQMEYAYAAADLVISRSGAMAIAELCLVKKPVLFIPYPFAAEDHQTANAKELVNRQAALMISNNLAVKELVPAVIALSKDEVMKERMENNISKLAIANADEVIAQQILNSIN
jgi:UDP-N-acetylglucosamine--N-acetylmuramyl-(pentapeptide) pyrophosphoryl-undecaprenol N-acetylglucosamine transferase